MRLIITDGLFWLSAVCCAIAQVFIIRSIRGTRHVPEPSAHVPRSRDAVELVWAVLPAAGLIVLFLFTWRAIHPSVDPTPASVFVAPAAS